MDWITDTLAIGGLRDLADFQVLERQEVEAVLQLCGHQREQLEIPLPIEHLRLEVEDRRPLPPRALSQGVKFTVGSSTPVSRPWSAVVRG